MHRNSIITHETTVHPLCTRLYTLDTHKTGALVGMCIGKTYNNNVKQIVSNDTNTFMLLLWSPLHVQVHFGIILIIFQCETNTDFSFIDMNHTLFTNVSTITIALVYFVFSIQIIRSDRRFRFGAKKKKQFVNILA